MERWESEMDPLKGAGIVQEVRLVGNVLPARNHVLIWRGGSPAEGI